MPFSPFPLHLRQGVGYRVLWLGFRNNGSTTLKYGFQYPSPPPPASGLRVYCHEHRGTEDLELFRFSDFGFWVSGSGFRSFPGFRFRVPGSGFRFWGFGFRVSGFGNRESCFGHRVSGFGFRVPGAVFAWPTPPGGSASCEG